MDDPIATRNSRLGLKLFALYFVFYAGFMALTVMRPLSMGDSVGPFNLGIAYGLFLIVSALVLAVVYMRACGED